MLRPGFPRLSHPEVAHAIPSVGFMAQVYRRVRLLVSPTIVGVQLTDQQRTAQAPRDAWGDVWRAVSSWHTLSALLLTAALIGCNWFAFLIAMENGQILQSSLGYFITPLVSILLGFVFLGERLHAVQWVAVALAAAGVANQILAVGELPWIALVLAGSFSL